MEKPGLSARRAARKGFFHGLLGKSGQSGNDRMIPGRGARPGLEAGAPWPALPWARRRAGAPLGGVALARRRAYIALARGDPGGLGHRRTGRSKEERTWTAHVMTGRPRADD